MSVEQLLSYFAQPGVFDSTYTASRPPQNFRRVCRKRLQHVILLFLLFLVVIPTADAAMSDFLDRCVANTQLFAAFG
jgi:hypothetical protein